MATGRRWHDPSQRCSSPSPTTPPSGSASGSAARSTPRPRSPRGSRGPGRPAGWSRAKSGTLLVRDLERSGLVYICRPEGERARRRDAVGGGRGRGRPEAVHGRAASRRRAHKRIAARDGGCPERLSDELPLVAGWWWWPPDGRSFPGPAGFRTRAPRAPRAKAPHPFRPGNVLTAGLLTLIISNAFRSYSVVNHAGLLATALEIRRAPHGYTNACQQANNLQAWRQARPPLSRIVDAETAARLRAVIGSLQRRLRTTPAAAAAGLTPTKISILFTVTRKGPIGLSELAGSRGRQPDDALADRRRT